MNAGIASTEIERCFQAARESLLAERNGDGFWPGELSTSALSTATAVCALALAGAGQNVGGASAPRPRSAGDGRGAEAPPTFQTLVHNGLLYLANRQNADGGWGDTPKSHSNISTTMLARAAFHIAGATDEYRCCLDRANDYSRRAGGIAAVRARYGKDKTFAVPILMTCALAGLADWAEVDALPFELACVPPQFFAALRLPVVSYALPALIAIGQARFAKHPPRNLLTRAVRSAAVAKSLRVLESIQPSSGGFLEATPLTSFVTMALVAAGQSDHPVTRKCVEFLVKSVRPDGSWPIDSNLSCWLTTLSVNALDGDLECGSGLSAATVSSCRGAEAPPTFASLTRDWILSCQFRERHPYTNAAPGGWGWTHLPGSVPDADDTAGALLALSKLPINDASRDVARRGVRWLLDLQNRDGGWPTFCRGWTNLPFDRSGADLTAHVMRALAAWSGSVAAVYDRRLQADEQPAVIDRRYREAIARGFRYLSRVQRPDGSWLPLWFGNEHVAGDENPVYGTARVLAAYYELGLSDNPAAQRGQAWLAASQNDDGGWGGAKGAPSSVEETAQAVAAMVGRASRTANHDDAPCGTHAPLCIERGLGWLIEWCDAGKLSEPSPIGFYFAKLWYYEKLYPLIFASEAFRVALRGPQRRDTAAQALRPSPAFNPRSMASATVSSVLTRANHLQLPSTTVHGA